MNLLKAVISPVSNAESLIAKDVLRWAVLALQQKHIETASLDARILLEFVLGVNREQLLFLLDSAITFEQYQRLETLVEKRSKRQPIAQLIGKREFWGMNFVVSKDTLDPRPDTETLIEYVLEKVANRAEALRILDLGTGTGCLLLSLLSELPLAKGVGVDFSNNALLVAKENALALGFADRTEFMLGDWCEGLEGRFDIILSNPPYIPSAVIPTLEPEVSVYEPKLALDGGEDGFSCYRKILQALPKLLSEDGLAAFEFGLGQEKGLRELAEASGFEVIGIRKDLSGLARSIMIKHRR